jgi:ABC-2 type transport system ATP-binding protein
MSSIGIETVNLVKQYENKIAVNGINLKIPRGHIFGFLGPNGAGKSTTISMLSTILPPTSGTANILGFDLNTQRSKIRELIGVCPQDLVIYELLTARENLHLIAQMHNLHPRDYKERTDELLGRMNLLDRADDQVKGYSGGMKRRINVLMAVIHDPDVIFLDEPSAGLDPQSRRVVWNFIKDFEKENKTVVLTTHNMEEADDLSEQLAIIDNGQIIAEGKPCQLKSQIGSGDVIEFRVPAEQLENRNIIVDTIKKNNGVQWVKPLGKELISIGAKDGLRNISYYYELVQTNFNFKMQDVQIRQNSLEDVFLELTGRQLRD